MDSIQKYRRHLSTGKILGLTLTFKVLPFRGNPFGALNAEQHRQIDDQALALAREHDLPYKRIRGVLAQIVYPLGEPAFDMSAFMGHSVPVGRDGEIHIRNLCFHRALEQLPGEEALSLFEHVDPELLCYRDRLFTLLTAPEALWSFPDELTGLLERFLNHQHRNRDPVIVTGWPNKPFEPSVWFDHLSPMRPTKMPVGAYDFRHRPLMHPGRSGRADRPQPAQETNYAYTWSPVQGPLYVLPDGSFIQAAPWETERPQSERPLQLCAYDDGSLMPGITPVRAAQLERDRQRHQQLQLDVLETCLSHLSSGEPEQLWREVLRRVRQTYTEEEAREEMAIDQFYHHEAPFISAPWRGSRGLYLYRLPIDVGGGFWHLLQVVGQIELERSTRFLTGTQWLVSLMASWGSLSGYFAAGAKLGFSVVDKVLEEFEALKLEEMEFQAKFAARVDKAIETEFRYPEVMVSMRVPREMESLAVQSLNGFREMVERRSESAAPLSASLPPAEAIRKQSSQPEIGKQTIDHYKFQVDGKVLKFKYKQIEDSLPVQKGDRYIAYLMSLGGRRIDPLTLVQTVEGTAAPPDPSPYSHPTEGELEDEGLPSARLDGNAKAKAAPKASHRVWLNAMAGMKEEVKSLKVQGKYEEAHDKQQQLDHVRTLHKREFGRGGRPRFDKTAKVRAYNAVRKAIGRSIDRIRPKDPELADVLRKAIRYEEGEYWFEWSEAIRWEV
jgi:hypothetical protein